MFIVRLSHDNFDFDRLWEDFGFSRKDSAKRSILNCCEIDKDYIIHSNVENGGLFPDKQSNYEVIKISREGFFSVSIII